MAMKQTKEEEKKKQEIDTKGVEPGSSGQPKAAEEQAQPEETSADKDPHRGITGTRPQHGAPEKSEDKTGDKEQQEAVQNKLSKNQEQPSPSGAGEAKEHPEAAQEKEPQDEETTGGDPHRGTAETPSQHKALEPGGERNNDDEYYDEDGALDEELDDLDDIEDKEEGS